MEKKINLIVKDKDKNLRVDVFLNKKENTISRSRIKKLILNRRLKLNNKSRIEHLQNYTELKSNQKYLDIFKKL